MLAITHAAIATAGVSLLLGTADPLPLVLAVLGSQLPDIDTTTSVIGQICFPVSSWIEDRYPHRTVTHSLIATCCLAGTALGIGLVLGEIKPLMALPLGHLLSCFSDSFTLKGVQLWWPTPVWCISVSNPKRRLRTGGPGEYWVLAIAVGLLMTGLWLAGAGGVQTQVNQGLGLRDGAISTYNRHASTSEVCAEITGVWTDDRTDASGKYLILGNQGSEFIITDGKSIYQTGKNIIVEKLVTKAGDATQRTLKTLSFNDQDLSPVLGELLASNSGARVYLTGSIVVDFPEEIRPVSGGRQLQTLTVAGDDVELTYHPLELAIAQLNDQWAPGTLTALILAAP